MISLPLKRRSRIVGPLRRFAKPVSLLARVGSNPTSSAALRRVGFVDTKTHLLRYASEDGVCFAKTHLLRLTASEVRFVDTKTHLLRLTASEVRFTGVKAHLQLVRS